MKKQLLKIFSIIIAACSSITLNAQVTATFEALTLSPDSYWNGSATPLGTTFASGDAIFPNFYDPAFGGYWASGWAYSNMKDSTTAGFGNMYSARTAIGAVASANYAIGQQGAILNLAPAAIGGVVNGVYVTNTTYAAIAMRDGDAFARKFGDTTGTGSGLPIQGTYPDWFKLSITGYRLGSIITDTVHFYLADYRFPISLQDYIVTNWQYVDLTSLGNVDSLMFGLSSSDVGMWGMNTPAFFAIDNLVTASLTTNIAFADNETLKMYPNPATNHLSIDLNEMNDNSAVISIFDIGGRLVQSMPVNRSMVNLQVADYESGVYFISVKGENTLINTKFIKK